MVGRKNILLKLFVLIFFLEGCASISQVKQVSKYRSLINSSPQKLAKMIQKNTFLNEKKNKLLKLLYLISVNHKSKQYLASIKVAQQAIEMVDKLYTKKISYKIKAMLVNDNSDIFYGEKFQHSMIFYYLSIDSFLYYSKLKKEKASSIIISKYKNKTRAALRSWDAFLSNMRIGRLGHAKFKRDLNYLLVGAAIHQNFGSRQDLQIALVMYQNVFDTIKKSYNLYPSFNYYFKKYSKDYSKLKKLNKKTLEDKYIKRTAVAKDLIKYVKQRMLIIARKISNKRFKNISKKISASKQERKIALKNFKTKTTFFILERGLSQTIKAKKIKIGINSVLRDPQASKAQKVFAGIAGVALDIYVFNVLGLARQTNVDNNAFTTSLGFELAKQSANEISIDFEIPSLKDTPVQTTFISSNNNKFVLTTPVNDLLNEALNEHIVNTYKNILLRIVPKHLTAIASSFVLYKALKKNSGDFIARSAAIFEYMAATKLIKKTEKADTRSWIFLPESIQITAIDNYHNSNPKRDLICSGHCLELSN